MTDNDETKYCSNCKRDIAAANYVMHEVHCKRNIVLCAKCQEPIPRTEVESHEEEYHKLVSCELCDKQCEVSAIDEHKENCPKRKVHCTYCEIDCPRDELEEHMGYCGTRTEECPKCSQYIMHKDRARHEDTACFYPPPPEPAAPMPDRDQDPFQGQYGPFGFYGGYHDNGSFRSDELMRLMEPDASFLRPRHRPMIAESYTRSRPRPGLGNPSRRAPLHQFGPRPGGSHQTKPIVSKRNDLRTKNTNFTRNQEKQNKPENASKTLANPLPDVNLPQGGNVAIDSSDREDLDRLLALQMGNGLDLESSDFSKQNLRQFGDAFGSGAENYFYQEELDHIESDGPSETEVPNYVPEQSDGASDYDVIAPCEFCNEEYPLASLIQHQSGCDMAPAALFTKVDRRDQHNDTGLNNAYRRQSPDERRDIPLVDNMAYMHAREDGLGADADDVMIPCEFCNEVYPSEVLLVHQPVCDKNQTKTPRARTPKVTNPDAAFRGQGRHFPRSQIPFAEPALHFLQDMAAVSGAALSRGFDSYGRYGKKTPQSSGLRRQTPEMRRQNSASKVHHTLDTLVSDPTDRPLNLGTREEEPTRDTGAAAESSTRYDPSFASSAPRNFRSKKPKVLPARTMNAEDLEEASGRRTTLPRPRARNSNQQPPRPN